MDIINRLLPSMNVKKGGRSCHTQLSIGKKPQSDSKEGTLFLMVCTAQDKNGTKFQVGHVFLHWSITFEILIAIQKKYFLIFFFFLQIKDNVEQIFAKFINEGKATIRFKDPEQDLCLCKAGVVTFCIQDKSCSC